jgi:hypothetical protein
MKKSGLAPVSPPNGASKGRTVKKVADLKTAVDNGTYMVESRKVADKIVKDAVRDIRTRLRQPQSPDPREMG